MKKKTHGGKRKGAGRKPGRFVNTKKAEPTVVKRIPKFLEDVVDDLIQEHKKRLSDGK